MYKIPLSYLFDKSVFTMHIKNTAFQKTKQDNCFICYSKAKIINIIMIVFI